MKKISMKSQITGMYNFDKKKIIDKIEIMTICNI